ncbi:nucleobase/nucleoside transporter [Leptomonas seymouri]|uniref:Nucleobase/nucleoside transporter n=1 Tax=Leptomonas seymouri TaxID=5684 RepID=A0A0N1I8E8_LEPSE|nr:nucleobase/nucleoside transporter [Leptomonas seymouri]|eukprot:KPI89102.1 nucleobase/nucleoside transporter [Leptomonas seymouri]
MAVTCEYCLLYAASTVLGFCCLFAYNSFLSSPSYLEHYFQFAAVKYTDNVSTLPSAKTKSFWDNSATWVTVLMIVPMLLMQFLMLSPFVLRQNVQARMIIGATFSLISVLIVPVCAAGGGMSEGGAMTVVIIACILCGAATTTFESAQYAFFGSLPTKFMTGYVLGGGFSGSINSVLRIVITVGLPSTFSGVKTSAVIFFSIGMALMVVTVIVVLMMRMSPLVRSYCADYRRPGDVARSAHAEAAEERLRNTADTALNGDELLHASAAIQKAENDEMLAADADLVPGSNEAPNDSSDNSHTVTLPNNSAAPFEEEGDPSVVSVVSKIWVMMCCLTGNMFTSLVLFPGIGLKAMRVVTESSSSSGDGTTWGAEAVMPMVIILMFNAGDTIGRLSSNFRTLWVPRFYVPFVVLVRAVACVIPLALGVCNPRVINSDANPIVVFLVLGITNGYLIGLTMAYGSSDPRLTHKERSIAGACLCFALLVGTTCGSVVSLIVVTQAF